MRRYLLSEITALLKAPKPRKEQEIEVLLTDSRSLTFPQRTLFVALVTERGDGHRYIGELYERGVRAFVVSKKVEEAYPEATMIEVPDTLQALQTLAKWRREALQMPIVAITGSNGKTTTKELLYQLLSPHLSVGRSPRSYNSQIGVPLSLWGLEEGEQLALIEAGISKPGEMARLRAIIEPTIGLITNIGEAHQEHFESKEQKVREKLSLFTDCETIIAPLDQPLIVEGLEQMGLTAKSHFWSFSDEQAELWVRQIEYHASGVTLSLSMDGVERELHLPFLDQGSIADAVAALLLLKYTAPSLLEDLTPFATLQPISMRLEVVQGKHHTLLINDSYNSDYDSLAIALDFLNRRNSDHWPTALILSDMQDSTHDPRELYGRVAELISRYQLDRLYLVGSALGQYRELFPELTQWYPDWSSLDKELSLAQLAGHIILLKGSHTSQFERVIEDWKALSHQTILSINLNRLTENYHTLRQQLPKSMQTICMIKANAYGAGSYEVARTLERAGTEYLAVAVVDEGRELREQGIQLPILVMNPELSAFRQLIWHQLEPEIFSLEMLRAFEEAAEKYGDGILPIHLKWNTGMNRLGITLPEIDEVVAVLRRSSAVRVASIFTHLAVADDPTEDAFTFQQLERLDTAHHILEERLGYSIKKHALNTAGAIRFPNYPSDFVRLGIGLYGISPLEQTPCVLQPIATLTTQILQVQEVQPGETIGYGRRGKVTRPSRIAIIPIGYADGLPRRLGNGRISFRLPDGTLAPTIGNICMDTLMIDVTDAESAEVGSEVTIFGEGLPITRLSDACDTIPYEIPSRLSSRIARQYFTE